MAKRDSFKTRRTLSVGGEKYAYFSLPAFAKATGAKLERLPFSIRVLVENLLRNEDGVAIRAEPRGGGGRNTRPKTRSPRRKLDPAIACRGTSRRVKELAAGRSSRGRRRRQRGSP